FERPLVGIGTFLARAGLKGGEAPGDPLDPREATLTSLPALPTTIESFTLNDAGIDGDEVAGNGFFSTKVPGLAGVDGPYRLRYSLDLTTGSCTTHRELVQAAFATLDVDPQSTPVTVASSTPQPGGTTVHSVTILPQDRLGNLAGPGLRTPITCAPVPGCRCD